ncbi:hypothetical protein GCM10020254_88340 [Streptomyces goshikiensis]
MRRLAVLLLALIAVFGVSVSAPQPAAANPPGTGVKILCQAVSSGAMGVLLGPVGGVAGAFGSEPACKAVGDVASKQFEEQWKKVWEGPLGDLIKSAQDAAKWTIQKVLTISLMAPSVDLKATGLWGGKRATLSGMLMWLGLLIATAGVMWQLAKMALTGQAKHAGRAMLGWVENIVLSTIGVALFVELLVIGDAISAGLVKGTFDDGGVALDRIIAVMIPKAVGNPVLMLGVVQVLVIVGFVQLVMVFLRQSAIPIICLLLPVVGGGRAGGDVTRQWAPKLITSGMVVVAYKPIVTVIICTGFAEFGSAGTLTEWLRGCATLVLAILAPGPLTKVFAPLGAAAGGGWPAEASAARLALPRGTSAASPETTTRAGTAEAVPVRPMPFRMPSTSTRSGASRAAAKTEVRALMPRARPAGTTPPGSLPKPHPKARLSAPAQVSVRPRPPGPQRRAPARRPRALRVRRPRSGFRSWTASTTRCRARAEK